MPCYTGILSTLVLSGGVVARALAAPPPQSPEQDYASSSSVSLQVGVSGSSVVPTTQSSFPPKSQWPICLDEQLMEYLPLPDLVRLYSTSTPNDETVDLLLRRGTRTVNGSYHMLLVIQECVRDLTDLAEPCFSTREDGAKFVDISRILIGRLRKGRFEISNFCVPGQNASATERLAFFERMLECVAKISVAELEDTKTKQLTGLVRRSHSTYLRWAGAAIDHNLPGILPKLLKEYRGKFDEDHVLQQVVPKLKAYDDFCRVMNEYFLWDEKCRRGHIKICETHRQCATDLGESIPAHDVRSRLLPYIEQIAQRPATMMLNRASCDVMHFQQRLRSMIRSKTVDNLMHINNLT